jgi:hypothetical protein
MAAAVASAPDYTCEADGARAVFDMVDTTVAQHRDRILSDPEWTSGLRRVLEGFVAQGVDEVIAMVHDLGDSRRWRPARRSTSSLPCRSGGSGWSAGGEGLQRVTAAVISTAQGYRSASRSRRRRPPRTSRPAAESRRGPNPHLVAPATPSGPGAHGEAPMGTAMAAASAASAGTVGSALRQSSTARITGATPMYLSRTVSAWVVPWPLK